MPALRSTQQVGPGRREPSGCHVTGELGAPFGQVRIDAVTYWHVGPTCGVGPELVVGGRLLAQVLSAVALRARPAGEGLGLVLELVVDAGGVLVTEATHVDLIPGSD